MSEKKTSKDALEIITQGKEISIIGQISYYLLVAIVMVGIITYLSFRSYTGYSVRVQAETLADEIVSDTVETLESYPAHQWLLEYWHQHADDMDIEYDAVYDDNCETAKKCREFSSRHPDLTIHYVTEEQAKALSPGDQKLYAEIAYAWLITDVDRIKQSYDVDFLFCVLTDDNYDRQFFLFSGADKDSVRGTEYEEVYPLGVEVTLVDNVNQSKGMRMAKEELRHLASAGDYMDYYAYIGEVDNMHALIGITFSLQELRDAINKDTGKQSMNAIVLQTLLSLICLVVIYFIVLKPMKNIQESIRFYRKTKNREQTVEQLLKVRTSNEMAELRSDIIDLTTEIDDYLERIETITAERERMGYELELAGRIQLGMLPSEAPDRKEVDLAASMDPAKTVGGDFYDYFMLDDRRMALVIADVSGKGIPAALFMMAAIILLRNIARNGEGPAEVLRSVNELTVARNRQEMFVSIWLGILDLDTGVLTASNAGHEYPAVKKADGSFEILKDKHGLVIGAMDGVNYSEYEIQMEKGAEVFVYTDGVAEATNANNELFGLDRMIEALRSSEDDDPAAILEAVDRSVEDFVGEAEQFDDLTMLCFRYNGKTTED